MNVNFKQPFKDTKGLPITDKGQKVLISDRVANLLFNLSVLHKEPLDGKKKYQAYKLCTRITNDPTSVELDAKEADFIEDVCSEAFASGAYGQIVDIIENNK